jgi:hypothetical protein
MARRRMISEELIYDEEFNRLSLEAQCLFIRMLAKADDCGVIPANEYSLVTLTNPPARVRKNLPAYLEEMATDGLGVLFEYEGKRFFAFKRDSFDRIQSYILNKRSRSEYLNLEAETAITLISNKFLEILGKSTPDLVESRKQKVEGRKQKEGPPSETEVVDYFIENGYPEELARRVFQSYDVADWHDSRGNKVRNWKQKMVQVWFKEENKNGTNQRGGGAGTREVFTPEGNQRIADQVRAIRAARERGSDNPGG